MIDGDEDVSARSAVAAEFKASSRVLWLVAAGIVRDASLAEDVVQEAAIVALGKSDQFRPGTNLTAWIIQIVRNVARNRVRKERRRRTATTDPALIDETTPARTSERERDLDGARSSDRLHFDEQVTRALDAVADVPRACLLLRTVEGMEYSKISQLLGIPAGTAMSHVHRTRRLLRERLADSEERLRAREETKS